MHILFAPSFIDSILKGGKTQTRRRTLHFDFRVGDIVEARIPSDVTPFAFLKIVKIMTEKLGELTEESIAREGLSDLSTFKSLWIKFYGGWNPSSECVTVDFEVVKRKHSSGPPY